MTYCLHPYGPLIEVLGPAPQHFASAASTARQLLDELHRQHPGLAAWKDRIACAQGEQLLKADDELDPAQDIALIPPVSGG